MSENTIYSVCGMCGVRCPIEVTVEDGRCRSIQGNRHAAGIRGALCVRGAAGVACVQDDERPQFPMLRKGGRGEGNWQRISWEEALDHAAAQIAAVRSRHGGRSILWSDTGGPFSDLRQALVRGLGSPNYLSRDAFLAANTQNAARSLFGFTPDALVYDLKNAREVVLQTRNLFESIDVQQANDLLDGLANGGKLTVIDIRATVTAGKADRFFLIRPGTDYALNLAVIHILLERKLYDESYAGKWIQDLDELRHLVSACTPEFAEAETGIKAADIVALAEALAKAAPKVIWHPGGMTARYTDSFFVCRTAYLINALLGAIGARGGLPLSARPADVGQPGLQRLVDLFPAVDEKQADGAGWKTPAADGGPGLLPLALHAMQTGEPYPIKACVVYQHDPLTELPEPDRLKTIFGSLDFLLCVTAAWTETAWQADLVLPLSPYLERESIVAERHGLRPGFLLRRRCTPPGFDTRADWEIVGGLARRLGLAPLAFAAVEEIWRYQLEGTGVSAPGLRGQGVRGTDRAAAVRSNAGRVQVPHGLGQNRGGQRPMARAGPAQPRTLHRHAQARVRQLPAHHRRLQPARRGPHREQPAAFQADARKRALDEPVRGRRHGHRRRRDRGGCRPGRLRPHQGQADRVHPPRGRLHGARVRPQPAGRVPGPGPGPGGHPVDGRPSGPIRPDRRRAGAAGAFCCRH